MQYLEHPAQKELQIVATSFILGLIFGGIYDIIRYLSILCGILPQDDEARRGGAALFCLDAAFMLLIGASFSVYVYAANDGVFRWFMAAGSALGFALWQKTAGKLSTLFALKSAAGVRRLLRVLLLTPLCLFFRALARGARFLWRHTAGEIGRTWKRARAAAKTNKLEKRLAKAFEFTEKEGDRR